MIRFFMTVHEANEWMAENAATWAPLCICPGQNSGSLFILFIPAPTVAPAERRGPIESVVDAVRGKSAKR